MQSFYFRLLIDININKSIINRKGLLTFHLYFRICKASVNHFFLISVFIDNFA